MKLTFVKVLAAVAAILVITGCSTSMYPAGPTPLGVIYTDVTVPTTDLTVSTDSAVRSTKIGEATATGVLGILTGDASVDAAMKDGRITKVHHIDHQYQQVLYMVYTRDTTIVYGE